jgi:CRISPR/Cas system-associated exonuclease Cas4 (RecB family)
MNARLLSPRTSLVEEIAAELDHEGIDFSMNLVVFPGKRPAHFLRKTIAGHAGSSIIPPVILSMDDFIDRAFLSIDERRKIDPLDAVALLYDIHCRINERIGGEGFRTLDAFFPIGLKLYRDMEEFLIEHISVSRLHEMGITPVEAMPGPSQQRIASFEIFYKQFYQKISEESLSTRSLRYRTVGEQVEVTDVRNFRKIIFAGFFALTASEKQLFIKMCEWENSLFFFQDGPYIREMLAQMGITPEKSNRDDDLPSVVFTESPDTHGQVFAIADMIAPLHDEGRLDEKSAIVLPSAETLFPLLRHGLPDFDDRDFNISLGYPLIRTPLFGFLHALMELIAAAEGSRMYIPAYLTFMLHPYVKNIYFGGRAETTRILFHAIGEYYARHTAKTFVALEEIESDERLFNMIMERLPDDENDENHLAAGAMRDHLAGIHRQTIVPFLDPLDVRDFSRKCIALLTYIAGQSTARLHPLFSPFCEAFIESLDAIAQSMLGTRRFEERSNYFTFFRRYLMTRHAPFEGTPLRGLQVLGLLETRNIRFDRVFVLDANEDILPDTKREDSLLPGRAREILGLPTYRERDRLAAYYFDVLVKGAKEVFIFFVENNRKEKSRFVEKILWDRQRRDRKTKNSDYVRSLQYRVRLENRVPQPVPKNAATGDFLSRFSYSATALDTYLACPLRFYYRFVLRVAGRPEVAGGIERTDIGNLVHTALADYFGARLGRPLTRRDLDPVEMTERIRGIMEDSFGAELSGRGYLLMRQVQKRLGDFLALYCGPLVQEVPVGMIEVEKKIKAPFRGFLLNGKIDAVQKRGDRTCIIDYKTSSNRNALRILFSRLDPEERDTWSAIGSLQLPVYRILYAHENKTGRTGIDALFILLGMTQVNEEIEVPLFPKGGGDSETLSAMLDEVIFRLLSEIADPSRPFYPTADRKKNCPICDYTCICGTQWVSR